MRHPDDPRATKGRVKVRGLDWSRLRAPGASLDRVKERRGKTPLRAASREDRTLHAAWMTTRNRACKLAAEPRPNDDHHQLENIRTKKR